MVHLLNQQSHRDDVLAESIGGQSGTRQAGNPFGSSSQVPQIYLKKLEFLRDELGMHKEIGMVYF